MFEDRFNAWLYLKPHGPGQIHKVHDTPQPITDNGIAFFARFPKLTGKTFTIKSSHTSLKCFAITKLAPPLLDRGQEAVGSINSLGSKGQISQRLGLSVLRPNIFGQAGENSFLVRRRCLTLGLRCFACEASKVENNALFEARSD